MIKHLEAEGFSATGHHGVKVTVALGNGVKFTLPVVWTDNDYKKNTKKNVTALTKALITNLITSINDFVDEVYFRAPYNKPTKKQRARIERFKRENRGKQ